MNVVETKRKAKIKAKGGGFNMIPRITKSTLCLDCPGVISGGVRLPHVNPNFKGGRGVQKTLKAFGFVRLPLHKNEDSPKSRD